MTRADIKSAVRNNLDELDLNFFTDQNLHDSIQDGYNSTALFTGVIEKTATLNFAATVYYDLASLIPDFYAVTKIFNNNTNKWLESDSRTNMDNIRENWETWTGQPLLFIPINFRLVSIIPYMTSPTGNFTVYYKAQAPTIASDSELIALPRYGESVLEHYTTKDALEMSLEISKAIMWEGHMTDDLKLIKKGIQGRNFPDKILVRSVP